MKKKEYDAYVRLLEITYGIRNVELRENQGQNIEELDAILDSSVSTPGPGSNALINLAHQLIAAKANLLNGASAPSAVSNAIAAADALIGSLDMAPVGSSPQVDPASVQGQSMLAQKDILDVYNNGNAPGGPAHCDRGGR